VAFTIIGMLFTMNNHNKYNACCYMQLVGSSYNINFCWEDGRCREKIASEDQTIGMKPAI